jgi:DNA-binding transcriptional LysR family regulator
MNLSFRQLQTFIEVMRTGSVSEAGRSLGRTQPAISSMLAGLEHEIGFPLFDRERGRLVPKPEAHYFLEEAENVLTRLSQSARTLQEIGNLEKGKLRIACNPAASSFFMPKILARFLKDKPNAEASLMMRSSPIVAEWIASQQYDIGFAEMPEPRRTIRMESFRFPCVCAIPGSDPLALKDRLTPEDLDGKPLALLFQEHTTLMQTRAAFSAARAKLNQRFELRTFLPALQLVSERLCYSICDSLSASSYNHGWGKDLAFRPFEPLIFLDMAIMTPANRPLSMLALSFSNALRHEVNTLLASVNHLQSPDSKSVRQRPK